MSALHVPNDHPFEPSGMKIVRRASYQYWTYPVFITIVLVSPFFVAADENSDESQAIAKVKLLGGKITRDVSLPGRPVVAISLRENQKFNDKYMHLLKPCTNLTSLDLSGILLTNDGLKEISQLEQLNTLILTGFKIVDNQKEPTSGITDQGLQHLRKLRNLTTLNLHDTKITDDGIKELRPLTTLINLDLSGTAITDDALNELDAFPDLRDLGLMETKITDDGLKTLGRFKKLTSLDLSYTEITDAGLKELLELQNLTGINLNGTQITDAGLRDVAKLKSLTNVHLLQAPNITKAGFRELERSFSRTLFIEWRK